MFVWAPAFAGDPARSYTPYPSSRWSMASSLQVFSQDSLLIADGDGGARKAATEDQLPSPDSSVTLLGDEFLRSPFGA